MTFLITMVRRVILAALLAFPISATAQIDAVLQPDNAVIRIAGLSDDVREALTANPTGLLLQVAGATSARGMVIDLSDDGQNLVVSPKFPLNAGTTYVVRLEMDGHDLTTSIAVPEVVSAPPTLISFAPSQSVIPANTLRLYLLFSQPMERGHLLQSVSLVKRDGTIVPNPFLNLDTELWDQSQTRATLLLDPGRIKQGVGPNSTVGAPLDPGESYRVIVHNTMKSAAGVNMRNDSVLAFKVGPPERQSIDPDAWAIVAPQTGTHLPLVVSFDRIMDTGGLLRLMTLHDPQGKRVAGRVDTDGGGWTLTPNEAWQEGNYTLNIAPELEDVSGNTISAAFDARTGTMGMQDSAETLSIRIAPN